MSDISTEEEPYLFSSFGQQSIQKQLHLRTGMEILDHYFWRKMHFLFNQIAFPFFSSHPGKIKKLISHAEQLLKFRKYEQSFNLASAAFKLQDKIEPILFQKAVLIMTQASLNQQQQLVNIKQILKIMQSRNKPQLQHRFLLMNIKLTQKQNNINETLKLIPELENIIQANGDNISSSEKKQIILAIAMLLLEYGQTGKAFSLLERWLPFLIKCGNLCNGQLAEIYMAMGLIMRKQNRLQLQYSYLSSASICIWNERNYNDTYIQIQCKKISNLMDQQKYEKSATQLNKIMKSVPKHRVGGSKFCDQLLHFCREVPFRLNNVQLQVKIQNIGKQIQECRFRAMSEGKMGDRVGCWRTGLVIRNLRIKN